MSPVVEDQDAPTPAKIARRVNIEHSYISRDQPLSQNMVQKTENLKRNISILTQKVRRKLQKIINKMTDLLKSIGEYVWVIYPMSLDDGLQLVDFFLI